MLYINKNGEMFGDEVKLGQFPDKTQLIKLDDTFLYKQDMEPDNYPLTITWIYDNDSEVMALWYLVGHIRSVLGSNAHIILYMPYVPNARMDRTKEAYEVFTLKHFCSLINAMNFDRVVVLDPHSDVCVGLLDRVFVDRLMLTRLIESVSRDVDCVFFPDAGAKKRYAGLLKDGQPVFYGEKKREWSTGKILGLDVKSEGFDLVELKGRSVLLIDDIIAYGGTMYHSIKKLKELGVDKVYIYCTHLENSVLDKEKSTLLEMLNDGTVEKLFTTKSLFSGKHDKIHALSINTSYYPGTF